MIQSSRILPGFVEHLYSDNEHSSLQHSGCERNNRTRVSVTPSAYRAARCEQKTPTRVLSSKVHSQRLSKTGTPASMNVGVKHPSQSCPRYGSSVTKVSTECPNLHRFEEASCSRNFESIRRNETRDVKIFGSGSALMNSVAVMGPKCKSTYYSPSNTMAESGALVAPEITQRTCYAPNMERRSSDGIKEYDLDVPPVKKDVKNGFGVNAEAPKSTLWSDNAKISINFTTQSGPSYNQHDKTAELFFAEKSSELFAKRESINIGSSSVKRNTNYAQEGESVREKRPISPIQFEETTFSRRENDTSPLRQCPSGAGKCSTQYSHQVARGPLLKVHEGNPESEIQKNSEERTPVGDQSVRPFFAGNSIMNGSVETSDAYPVSDNSPNTHASTQLQDIKNLRKRLERIELKLVRAKTVASTRQAQYQEILKELAEKEEIIEKLMRICPVNLTELHVDNKTRDQLMYLESEVNTMTETIDDLNFEITELKDLLVEKDKQIAEMKSVDSINLGCSSIQLGVQAINPANSTEIFKNQLAKMRNILQQVNIELGKMTAKYEEACVELTEKRQETIHLAESVSGKDLKILKLDNDLVLKEKEIEKLKADFQKIWISAAEKLAKAQSDLKIAEYQYAQLREELSSRDDTILNLKSEVVRQSKYNQDAENRIKSLIQDISDTQQELKRVIKETVCKEKYMFQLERELKEDNIRKQVSYLSEIAKNLKLKLGLTLKEDECRNTVDLKDSKISDLQRNLEKTAKQVGLFRQLVCSKNELESGGSTSTKAKTRSSERHKSCEKRLDRSASSSNGTFGAKAQKKTTSTRNVNKMGVIYSN